MNLLPKHQAEKLSEDELRDLIYSETGRRVPRSISKDVLVSLASGELDAVAEKKVFSGRKPDDLDKSDMHRYSTNELKKMAAERYKFKIPQKFNRKLLEKLVQCDAKASDLSSSDIRELGKINMEGTSLVFPNPSSFAIPKIKKRAKPADVKRGEFLAKRLTDKRYTG